ncbi:hypothetical protein [Mycetocola lacteus]|uniref:hypothetical protein n=1 Tax=Mycetocola lacteus TaxID=76637 RepID=UPI0011C4A781|nr:hypothetical protein [Mycetocola lacteus]
MGRGPQGSGPPALAPPPGGYGYPQGPGPSRKKRGWIIGLVVTLAVIALLIALPFIGSALLQSAVGNLGAQNSQAGKVPTYTLAERPGMPALQDRTVAMYDEYSNRLSDGSIFTIVPRTDAGLGYVRDFLTILADKKAALRFMTDPVLSKASTNQYELDAEIRIKDDELTEVERKFLAGEDLGVTIRVTNADGSVYESDGSATKMTEDRAAAEKAVRERPAQRDDQGSYAQSAADLAAEFGLLLDFNYDSIYANCVSAPGTDITHVVASYCRATPDRIYVNPGFGGYPANLTEPTFLDTIRHEIAHHVIGQICGTSSPVITGELNEGVTNSYAVKYLGADRDYLNRSANSFPQYLMTDQTDDLARQIGELSRCE